MKITKEQLVRALKRQLDMYDVREVGRRLPDYIEIEEEKVFISHSQEATETALQLPEELADYPELETRVYLIELIGRYNSLIRYLRSKESGGVE